MNEPRFELDTSSTSNIYCFRYDCVKDVESLDVQEKKEIVNIIKYSQLYKDENRTISNLAFGPINIGEKKIEDLTTEDLESITVDDLFQSSSGNRDQILRTVAASIYSYTDNNPGIQVLFRGSTESRTRLYRRAINLNYKDISEDFNIFGVNFVADEQEGKNTVEILQFCHVTNFDGYIVVRK